MLESMRPTAVTAAATLALALALPLPSLSGEVKVQPGETLSEIADRLGVSMKRLMELNALSDPDHVEAGTALRLPPGVRVPGGSSGGGGGTTVTVGQGETLSDIADRHGITVSSLIALNGLSDPDHVEAGQVLKLRGTPRPAAAPRPAATPSAFTYTPGASEHVVRKGESLSAIARGTGVPLSQLVALNAISNPDNVPAGSTLRLIGRPAAPVPTPRAAATPTAFTYTPGASEHVVRKGESLSAISRGTGVPLSQLVALNAIRNPNTVPAGGSLRLTGRPA
ncbi:MAG: LysM peptidoglycan-binding domain-containing protein, partial [Cyanobacteriota bacterium]